MRFGWNEDELTAGAFFASTIGMKRLLRLRELGQSVWLDYLDRKLLTEREFDRMLTEDGLAGMTSNPTIFLKAIAGSSDYDQTISAATRTESNATIFERIEIEDVTRACDRFRPLYDETRGADGFVSIEVSPERAFDTDATVAEVHRLWTAVNRPNVMVKIPGTRVGVPAIERCLADGININVTLLFAVDRYVEVAGAFLQALETRVRQGKPIDAVGSVASFFVSRIDTKIDRALDALPESARRVGRPLRGRIAIANATIAYAAYRQLIAQDRWRALAAKGAHPQRLLWASTSTKDPAYRDLHYADALIAPETVDTMPLATLRAFRDRGSPEVRLTEDAERARTQLATLAKLGIQLDAVTSELEYEGVRAFTESHEQALEKIAEKRRAHTTIRESTTGVTTFRTFVGRDETHPAEPERDDPHVGMSNPDQSTWSWERCYLGPPEAGQPRRGGGH
jgi:transaldolase